MDTVEYKKSVCPLDCPDSCGVVATVKNGRVTALQGDKDHPYTNGFICRKMRSYPERIYSESRVSCPQIRVGAKGAGIFKRIEWDEALEILSSRLLKVHKEHGGEAILPYSYAGNMGAVNRFAGYPLFHRLDASQLDQTICSAAAGAGWDKQCAGIPGCPPENAADARLIVAWGINVKVTNVHFWQYIAAARKKGAKLLVIDPYRNETAKSADFYQQVKPGGDCALALGIVKALLEKGGVDDEFIGSETQGFEEFSTYVESCQWQVLEADCGLARQDIESVAELLAASPKTFLRIGIGMTRHSRGGMAIRAVSALAASLGLFSGGKGRGVLLTAGAFKGEKAKLTYPALASRKTRVINMIQLGHALTVLDPPVKALFVYNTNPLSVNPDGVMVRKGLAREDLFTVVHEQVMTPTAMYADLLLPATTFLENRDVYTAYGHFFLRVAKPAIEPVAEAWSNFDLFQKLALKMGFMEPPFQQTCEERIADYLDGMQGLPDSCTVEELLAGKLVCSTKSRPDGRVLTGQKGRFQFVSSELSAEPVIPCLTEPGECGDKDLISRFPLSLITPPHPDLLNSTFGERFPGWVGELLVHPEDAKTHKIVDGETVLLQNHRGRTVRVAKVSTDTQKGLVVAEGIFWQTKEEQNGINDVTSQKLTDMGAGATFHESRVSICAVR